MVAWLSPQGARRRMTRRFVSNPAIGTRARVPVSGSPTPRWSGSSPSPRTAVLLRRRRWWTGARGPSIGRSPSPWRTSSGRGRAPPAAEVDRLSGARLAWRGRRQRARRSSLTTAPASRRDTAMWSRPGVGTGALPRGGRRSSPAVGGTRSRERPALRRRRPRTGRVRRRGTRDPRGGEACRGAPRGQRDGTGDRGTAGEPAESSGGNRARATRPARSGAEHVLTCMATDPMAAAPCSATITRLAPR